MLPHTNVKEEARIQRAVKHRLFIKQEEQTFCHAFTMYDENRQLLIDHAPATKAVWATTCRRTMHQTAGIKVLSHSFKKEQTEFKGAIALLWL